MTRLRAVRQPVHRGPAAWAEILGAVKSGPALEGAQTADVVIVGAGFAGLCAAHRLRQLDRSLSVCVLEAGTVAEGAAGRNSGFMIDLPHDLASDDYAGGSGDAHQIKVNRQAIEFAKSAVSEYEIPTDFADPAGKINGAATAKGDAHNRSYGAHLAGLGEPSEWLDRAAMKALTGSDYYLSGLYTPGTLMLQPAGYVWGLAQGLRREGVHVFEQSGVTEIVNAGPDWQVKTTKGQITAARVILAVNGHLESFGIARGHLMQIFLFASMTGEIPGDQVSGAPRWGITPADPMGTTVRRIDGPQGGNRIITRTCAVMRPGMEVSQRDVARASAVHQRKFDARFPTLAGTQMQYQWAGHLCLTRNGVAVSGAVADGVFSACVQNGLGTVRGTLTGIAAAEMALGAASDITRHFASEGPPTRLPPRPFAGIGANTYLRWKEWRAGAE